LALLTEFAADHVAHMIEHGQPIPPATDLDDVDSPDDERVLIPRHAAGLDGSVPIKSPA
jgi:hypothetical protein